MLSKTKLNRNNSTMMKNGIRVFQEILFILISMAEIDKVAGSYWSKTFLYSGVNPSIVGKSEPSKSVMQCTIECSKSSQYTSLYYSTTVRLCYCNTNLDGGVNSTAVNTGLVYGIRDKNVQFQQRLDCLGLLQQGHSTDGVYVIYPSNGVATEAWCDMNGGGWTVIQRRQDGSVNFTRLWNDYAAGFGNKIGEYWLGLENMHVLTQDNSSLRIELESTGITGFAEYSHFAVGASVTNYTLSVSGFTGNGGDSLSTYHNGMMFSTLDADNDNATSSCVSSYSGVGWWHKTCFRSHLNLPPGGIYWLDGTCMTTASKSVMKIKRNV